LTALPECLLDQAVLAGTAGRIDRGGGTLQGDPYPEEGSGGLGFLVQHDGFVAIYSHLGMAAPSFAQGKRSVAAGENLGVVGRTGVGVGTHIYFEMLIAGKPVDPAPYLRVPKCDRER
jgi:murein DD-endopeptidase MepM/ murein hydrolase activator NlpD